MTSQELKAARVKLEGEGYGAIARMAKRLQWPYRTYQDRERGDRPIKDKDAQAVALLLENRDLKAKVLQLEDTHT